MLRSTGTTVTTLGEPVRAVVPHPLPPTGPALAPDSYAAGTRAAGEMPRFTIEQARQRLDTTFPTATAAVKLLEALGIVTELTGQKKNRSFSYQAYVDWLAR